MELLIPNLGSFYSTTSGSMNFAIDPEPAVNIIMDKALKYMNVVGDAVGLYQSVRTDRYSKAKFNKLTQPKHVLQAKVDCDTWTPKGKMGLKPFEVLAYPYEMMTEHCNDVFTDCMRYVKGKGTDVNDITATAEGESLLAMMTESISNALGNSIFDVVSYSNHSVLADANTNSWYDNNDITALEWADYYGQQTATVSRGHITLIEDYKAAGLSNFSVALDASDFSGDTFIGGTTDTTIIDTFKRVEAAAKTSFRTSLKRMQGGKRALMLVTRGIFDAYEDYVLTTYKQIPSAYQYFVQGEGTILSPNGS